ncbi:MAG TPA: cysteine hydrolase family protein [Burkholderiales bacterium]|nr:cysteine hydrolase family protein [Burkholderiales bacterium]
MTTALLLVDVQNDYFAGGAMPLDGMDRAAARAARLLAAFRARGLPIVHVRHLSVRPGATFFVPGTPGADIHASVAPRAGEPVVEKNFPNAFRATDLEPRLRAAGADHLVIAGAMSHMCIDATARAAFDHGFTCTVAEDACATRALEFAGRTLPARDVHAAFMAALAVPYAKIAQADACVDALAAP